MKKMTNMDHKHLFKKKKTRKITLNNGEVVLSVKYECSCSEWLSRQIKDDKAPLYWEWEIYSDKLVKLQTVETSGTR